MSKLAVAGTVFTAALSGLLTRPCCILPVALSTFGLSSAVIGEFVAAYRPILLTASVTLLAASVMITMRREGGTASKVVTVSMSVIAFVITRAWTGVF